MSEWKEYKLGEVADVQTGPFGSQLHMNDYKDAGTPIITVEHLGANRIIHNNLPLVGDEDRKRLIKYTLCEGDIVFSRVGSVDRRAYVSSREDGWLFSGRCLRVRPHKNVNSRFLSYYFGLEDFKETIRRIAVGATMPSINTSILSDVSVSLPPFDEQKRIAGVLSSLDDKIDLLHRESATLEALAETLFRHYFIENPNPEWKEGKLGELINIGSGKALKHSDFVNEGLYPVLGANGKIGRTNEYLVNETDRVLYTGRVGTLGKVFRLEGERAWLSDNTLVIKPKCHFNYVYFLLKQANLQDLDVGSTQPLIRQSDVVDIDVIIPNDSIIDTFEKEMCPLFEKIKSNQQQMQTLAAQRDAFLPRLMSGEVKITEQ